MKSKERQDRKEAMFARIEQCRQSGLSKKEYCRQNQITPSLFYYWQKKYKEQHHLTTGFLPLHIKETPGFLNHAFEIQYPNGVCLRMAVMVDAQQLRMLINLQ